MDQGFQYECPTEETNRNVVLNDAVETNGIGENTSNSILLNVFTLTGSLTIETYLYYTVTQLKQQVKVSCFRLILRGSSITHSFLDL